MILFQLIQIDGFERNSALFVISFDIHILNQIFFLLFFDDVDVDSIVLVDGNQIYLMAPKLVLEVNMFRQLQLMTSTCNGVQNQRLN